MAGHNRTPFTLLMKPSKIKSTPETIIQTNWPAFLWGPPGAGKLSIVRETASDAGMQLLDVRASLLIPPI